MLTILLQIFPQILSLAIEERREQFVAITPNYNVVVGKQHFQNYHYNKDHYQGKRKGRCFAFKIPPTPRTLDTCFHCKQISHVASIFY